MCTGEMLAKFENGAGKAAEGVNLTIAVDLRCGMSHPA